MAGARVEEKEREREKERGMSVCQVCIVRESHTNTIYRRMFLATQCARNTAHLECVAHEF